VALCDTFQSVSVRPSSVPARPGGHLFPSSSTRADSRPGVLSCGEGFVAAAHAMSRSYDHNIKATDDDDFAMSRDSTKVSLYTVIIIIIIIIIIIRPHRTTTCMRPIVTDRVAWSVGRSVCHDREPCKNHWTDRDAVWMWTRVGLRKHVLWGVQISQWEGAILRVGAMDGPLQSMWTTVTCGCDAAFCQTTLTTCYYCYYYRQDIPAGQLLVLILRRGRL